MAIFHQVKLVLPVNKRFLSGSSCSYELQLGTLLKRQINTTRAHHQIELALHFTRYGSLGQYHRNEVFR